MKNKQFKVTLRDEGQPLLAFLKRHLKDAFSGKAIKRLIDNKHCTINGRVEFFSTYRLRKGEIVHVDFPLISKKILPEILYEDEDILAYNKPPNLSSQYLKGGRLVHRLDKETSGVILMAKNDVAYKEVTEQFAKRVVKKKYFAICDGIIEQKKWKCDDYLRIKTVYQGGVIYGRAQSKEEGKKAITFFQCVKTGKKASFVEVYPITGRTHQIRVQCNLMKHPILGDWQYASSFQCSFRPKRCLLHAHQIDFFHPRTKEKMTFTAPIPEDFIQAKNILFEGQ